MKVLIVCSKQFYSQIEEIKSNLEEKGIEVFLPNCYNEPDTEKKMWNLGQEQHREFKAKMYKQSEEVIKNMDAVLVLNYDKQKGENVYRNYIGGATFLEMYDAFRLGKKIYLYNEIPEGILYDEIDGFNPTVINGNLDLIEKKESVELTDEEFRAITSLCKTASKFNLHVIVGKSKSNGFNCIFKNGDKWNISFSHSEDVLEFDDVVFACYKIIKNSVNSEIVDFVLNYFNESFKQNLMSSSFLEYACKKKQRVKKENKY